MQPLKVKLIFLYAACVSPVVFFLFGTKTNRQSLFILRKKWYTCTRNNNKKIKIALVSFIWFYLNLGAFHMIFKLKIIFLWL